MSKRHVPWLTLAVAAITSAGVEAQVADGRPVALAAAVLIARGRRGQSTVARWVTLTLGVLLVAEALALVAYRDHHGGALLTGVGIAALLIRGSTRAS